MRIKLGYPTKRAGKTIIKRNITNPLDIIEPIADGEELDNVLENISNISIKDEVMDYLVNIVGETRNKTNIELGVSPRGSIALFKASRVYAGINGRDYIIPEDIKAMAPYVLNHRIIARGVNRIEDSIELIEGIVNSVEVPFRKYI